jgi:hypothetical protein
MDNFVLSSSTLAANPSSRTVYISSILKLEAARRLAFNSQRLLTIYTIATSSLLKWFLLDLLSSLHGSSSTYSLSTRIFGFDTHWTRTADVIMGYILILGVWTAMKDWILR